MITVIKSFLSQACIRATGFKHQRFVEWRDVLVSEGRAVGWGRLARILVQEARDRVGQGVWGDRRRWRVGMRECGHCDIYNKRTRACRDLFGLGLGCGCFMPVKRLAPGQTCWLKQIRSEKTV